MNQYLKYPEWQVPLKQAIVEFNPRHLPEKLRRAEDAIGNRVLELASNENSHEKRMLADGLLILRDLKDRLMNYHF